MTTAKDLFTLSAVREQAREWLATGTMSEDDVLQAILGTSARMFNRHALMHEIRCAADAEVERQDTAEREAEERSRAITAAIREKKAKPIHHHHDSTTVYRWCRKCSGPLSVHTTRYADAICDGCEY